MPRTALFVIDIQNDLADDPHTEIPHAARIRQAGSAILERARAKIDARRGSSDLEIVMVQHEERPEEGSLVRGSRAWELVFLPRGQEGSDKEEGLEERVVGKTTGDTFESNPDLAAQLRSRGVETIIAFGIQSDMCVRATCKGAVATGFDVILLHGAHSTYDDGSKTAEQIEADVEEELTQIGVKIVDWEDWQA